MTVHNVRQRIKQALKLAGISFDSFESYKELTSVSWKTRPYSAKSNNVGRFKQMEDPKTTRFSIKFD